MGKIWAKAKSLMWGTKFKKTVTITVVVLVLGSLLLRMFAPVPSTACCPVG